MVFTKTLMWWFLLQKAYVIWSKRTCASNTVILRRFLRNTPLIFGDLVNTDNGYWNLILLLIQIVNIVFSPVVTQGMIFFFLKHLISDHKLFKSMFPERRLIPKHHLIIHYTRCIRKVGPLIHMLCMRYEGKHNFKSVKNFKNITKTSTSVGFSLGEFLF